MMKKFFWIFMMAAAVVFTACSDDSEGYDADSAVSNYVPSQSGRKVASLYTTNVIDGREYSFRHNFTYDKQGRIKEVNSEIQHHRLWNTVDGRLQNTPCNITSNAKYYYKGEFIDVACSVVGKYPEKPSWDYSRSFTDGGRLNDNGHIITYSQPPYEGFECEYNFTNLRSVAFDGGYLFDILRDAAGNVNGHRFTGYDKAGNDSTSTRAGRYQYTAVKNKTNFDFAAYFGYWEHERFVSALSSWPYATYQLAAFGFFGSCGNYLPLCDSSLADDFSATDLWEFDEMVCPVKYTAPDGRVTEITYVE